MRSVPLSPLSKSFPSKPSRWSLPCKPNSESSSAVPIRVLAALSPRRIAIDFLSTHVCIELVQRTSGRNGLDRTPGRPEGFHLQPPTEPCVNLSIYTARPSHCPATLR